MRYQGELLPEVPVYFFAGRPVVCPVSERNSLHDSWQKLEGTPLLDREHLRVFFEVHNMLGERHNPIYPTDLNMFQLCLTVYISTHTINCDCSGRFNTCLDIFFKKLFIFVEMWVFQSHSALIPYFHFFRILLVNKCSLICLCNTECENDIV